jgi:cyclopropane-fatty-acyl-phospholipid synthase
MSTKRLRSRLADLLSEAGVRLDGAHPWDVKVKNEDVYERVLAQGTLGVGEAYVDGWWDCESIDELVCRIWRLELPKRLTGPVHRLAALKSRLVNCQNGRRAFEVGRVHYDLGNDLYERMLDRRMIYSCGYWKDASTLDEAQEAKLDLIARKLELRPGMRVLDIGCGWGGTLNFMRERYGVEGLGITVSVEQARHANEQFGGGDLVYRGQDYRNLNEKFDRILSVGMFEHVGVRNYREYFRTARRCLADDGLFLLHTIGDYESSSTVDPWIERYIFPNSVLPSASQITDAAEGLLLMEDWHNFGADYDKTLMAWEENFRAAWPELKERYDERFFRMWRYYLLSCAGSFRARITQLWQIVFSPNGVAGGYNPDNIR